MIVVNHVSKTFKDKKNTIRALDNVSFQVHKGEVVGLLGENGAGKTTLLRIIATIMEASKGTVHIDGKDTQKQAIEVKRNLGVLFGGETGMYERLTARENLEYFAGLYHLPHSQTRQRIDRLSEQFGMQDYLDRKVSGFSKGMRQKVAIARALLHNPEYVIFDEPTTGLDITSAHMFRELIQQLAAEGKTIIFSSHIMEEVSELCKSVVMIHKGRMVYNGTLASLYEQAQSNHLHDIFISRVVRGERLQ